MDPATLAIAGLGSTIVGGGLKAFGEEQSGAASQKMYNYKAAVAKLNSDTAKQNAEYALNKGAIETQTYGMQAAQRQGQIKVAQAASNLDVNSGSNKAVQDSQRLVSAIDMNQIRANAAKTAYDYDVQAVNFENDAKLDKMAGKDAMAAGQISALGTLVGTAGSVSDKWLQGSQVGLFGGGSGGGGGSGFQGWWGV